MGDKTDEFVPPFQDAANALKPGEMTKPRSRPSSGSTSS